MNDRSAGASVAAAMLFGGSSLAVAFAAHAARRSGQDWYDDLDKPSFTPPDATFGIVWTALYVVIPIAGWIAWRSADTITATVAWAVQLALNLLWTVVFFGLEAPLGGLAVMALLLVAVAVLLAASRRASSASAALLFPYVVWLLFAASVNVGVVVLN